VKHYPDGHKGAFGIEQGGTRVATMTYTMAGGTMVINHTEVDPVLRGTGAGGKLVDAAVNQARQDHLRINPVCPFAKAVFDKKPEYADVLSR